MRSEGWLAATLAMVLAGCGPATTTSTAMRPMSRPASPPSSAVPAAPARVALAVPQGATVELDDGSRLELAEIVTETIEAAPDDPGSYPAGSGVTVTVALDGVRGAMSLLSAGYTSSPVAWIGDHRIELVGVDARGAHVLVDRITDRVLATQTIRIRRGETVRLHARVDFAFRSHGHKRAEPGVRSPLLVRVAYDGVEQDHALFPPSESSFRWRDLRFTLGEYHHDDDMVLAVDRLALEAVVARPPGS